MPRCMTKAVSLIISSWIRVVGWHIHHGDGETYYILKGHGEYNDNGTAVRVGPGDVTFVDDGEGHSLKNTGDETLEAIALILFK